MADTIRTRHLVKPDGWDESPFADSRHFFVEVALVNASQRGARQWAVSEYGFTGYGFTRAGKRVAVSGHDKINSRHALMSEDEALRLAADIVDGKVEADGFTALVVASAQFRASRVDETGTVR